MADLRQVAETDGVIALSNIRYADFSPDNPVQRSLSAIRKAHFQLRSLKTASATSDALASQIALYDLILYEISDIRAGLAKRFCGSQSTDGAFQIPLRRLN
jgi:hypothetical protein